MIRVFTLFFCAVVAMAACSSNNGSSPCDGTPPDICTGCCGAKIAANACVDGAWSCAPTGVACARCDADAGDAMADGAVVGDAMVGDASEDATACSGDPPRCTNCCGGLTTVECQGGRWMCPFVACPICQLPDAATDAPSDGPAGDARPDDAAACAGSAPNCFGNDATRCCGQDPAGRATCSGGQWLCGSAPAPGCNGQSCLLISDAGPG